MKKALVILLALTMVMSMFAMLPFGASAADELAIGAVAADYKPEGTAIKTAEEFAAMATDGTYYLAENITVDATYMESFTGTFDGNGKTITTSVPLFDNFNGVLKNLTVDGVVTINTPEYNTATRSYDVNSPIAHMAGLLADTTIENVCNKAAMNSTTVGMAGIVGMGGVDGNTDLLSILTIKNCANYGNIAASGFNKNNDSGGIVGRFFGKDGTDYPQLVIDGCVNYGTVNADGRPGGIVGVSQASATIINTVNNGDIQATYNYCGGIAGRLGENAPGGGKYGDNVYVIENSINNGNVNYTGASTFQGGGFVGYLGACAKFTFKNLTNNGDISATVCTNKNAGMGGIIGNGEDKYTAEMLFENCVNNGDITTGTGWASYSYAGGIAGSTLVAKKAVFKNCVNNGKVTGDDISSKYGSRTSAGIVGMSKSDLEFINCINNGDVFGAYAAGIVASNHTADGQGLEDLILVGCGNAGDITGKTVAAGLVGATTGKSTHSVVITNSFNVGEIYNNCKGDNKYTSGLVSYYKAEGAGFTIKYCYSAGAVSADSATTDANDVTPGAAAFKFNTQFKFNHAGTDYYFSLPYNADSVTITGTKVVPTYVFYEGASSGNGVAVTTGKSVNEKVWCHFTSDSGKAMAFRSTVAGVITIDGETATIDGVAQVVECLDINVYTSKSNTISALINTSDNSKVGAVDIEKNVVIDSLDIPDYYIGLSPAGAFRMIPTNNDNLIRCTAAELKNGTVAFKLNELAGEQVFFQNLDAELFNVDLYPTTDKSHAKVVEVGGVLTNEVFDTANDSGSPSTGDATIYVVVALAVSTISLAAVAVVRKNKEN